MQLVLHLIAFIITVLILITVHEFGHYIVAKWIGIKVLKFSIGFGKPLWQRIGKNGTEFVIAVLPLGGYVRLLDEREGVVAEGEKHLAFNRKSVWKRALVVLAGPGINFLFAIIAFTLMFVIGIDQVKPIVGKVIPHSIAAQAGMQPGEEIQSIDNHQVLTWQRIMLQLAIRMGDHDQMTIIAKPPQGNLQTYHLNLSTWAINSLNPDPLISLGLAPYAPPIPVIINKVMPQGPAGKAGILPGDQVLAVDGKKVTDWQSFVEYVQKKPNQSLSLNIQRGSKQMTIAVIPSEKLMNWHWVGYLGVETLAPSWPASMRFTERYNPLKALWVSVEQVSWLTTFNFVVLGKMMIGKISLQTIGGPISIFESAGEAFRQGIAIFIAFLGLISVMLAFVNILPIPGLDGGHLLFFAIEGIMRKPLSVAAQLLLVRLGMIFLVVLIVQATINDFMRLFTL